MSAGDDADRLVQAIEMHARTIAAALGGLEDAIRNIPKQGPPPSSRPSSGKLKTAGRL